MNNSKKLIVNIAHCIGAALLLASCSSTKTFYQVYEVKSDDVPVVEDHFVFNNDDVMVRYDFCDEGGNVTFYCFNKSDKTIYLQLDNSFYIHNGIAYDYYKDCEYTTAISSTTGVQRATSSTQSASAGIAKSIAGLENGTDGYYVGSVGANLGAGVSRTNESGYYNSSSRSQSVTNHAPRVIAIPPHFAKYIDGFTIQDKAILLCGEDMYDQNYPSKSSRLFSYTLNDTPVKFSNHIAYSFSQDGTDMKSFINNFYVSSMQNNAEKVVLVKNQDYKPNDGINKQRNACRASRYIFTVAKPTVFYNVFSK